MNTHLLCRATMLGAILLTSASCAERPTSAAETVSLNPPRFGATQTVVRDVPSVVMDLPPVARSWDSSDQSLDSAASREDGNVMVAFKPPTSSRAASLGGRRSALSAAEFQQGLDLVRANGAEIIYVYSSFGAVWIKAPSGVPSLLRRNPLVDFVEPRQRWRVAGVRAGRSGIAGMLTLASDPQETPWGLSMIRAPEAWAVDSGSDVKIEIIDTGMEPHEDLPFVPESNCSGFFGFCSDGPVLFHGTHVSGTILARDNSVGVIGGAPGIAGTLVYVWRACNGSTGACDNLQIAAGIDAGISAGVRVINMSLGGPDFDQGTANAVAAAWNTSSIVLVAAAGNLEHGDSPQTIYPAALTNVLGVSGVRTDASFATTSPCPDHSGGFGKSNQGSFVDLAAPFWAYSTVQNNSYEGENQGWCGTSMATPHVTAAAALVTSQNPTWSNAQVSSRLTSTARDLGAVGRDDLFGFGLVDAAAAVGLQPPPAFTVAVTGPSAVDACTTATWTAPTTGGTAPITYHWTVEGNAFDTGTINQLIYTNSGQSASVFVIVTATDATTTSRTSSPFKTNIRLPGAC